MCILWACIDLFVREKGRENNKTIRHTYLMLSVWVLYSMMVLGGRLRTRRSVSLMRAVVDWSLAVLFQIEMMSSWRKKQRKHMWVKCSRAWLGATDPCLFGGLPGSVLTLRPHRSPLQPWTAPRAWPGSGSPSNATPGLSSGGWSTSHPSCWRHPKNQ